MLAPYPKSCGALHINSRSNRHLRFCKIHSATTQTYSDQRLKTMQVLTLTDKLPERLCGASPHISRIIHEAYSSLDVLSNTRSCSSQYVRKVRSSITVLFSDIGLRSLMPSRLSPQMTRVLSRLLVFAMHKRCRSLYQLLTFNLVRNVRVAGPNRFSPRQRDVVSQ